MATGDLNGCAVFINPSGELRWSSGMYPGDSYRAELAGSTQAASCFLLAYHSIQVHIYTVWCLAVNCCDI
jgi:hypothetical protein